MVVGQRTLNKVVKHVEEKTFWEHLSLIIRSLEFIVLWPCTKCQSVEDFFVWQASTSFLVRKDFIDSVLWWTKKYFLVSLHSWFFTAHDNSSKLPVVTVYDFIALLFTKRKKKHLEVIKFLFINFWFHNFLNEANNPELLFVLIILFVDNFIFLLMSEP